MAARDTIVPGVTSAVGPAGRHGLYLQETDGRLTQLFEQANQIQYDWGLIAAKLIGFGDLAYKPSTIFLEYENLANPLTVITPPSFTRDAGIDYYDDLALSSTKDYLRVPLQSSPVLSAATGFTSYFTAEGTGNKLTFLGIVTGSVGVHGRPFATANNSKIYGAALVATPDENDHSKDLILARMYYASGNQAVKDAVRQFVPTWELAFK